MRVKDRRPLQSFRFGSVSVCVLHVFVLDAEVDLRLPLGSLGGEACHSRNHLACWALGSSREEKGALRLVLMRDMKRTEGLPGGHSALVFEFCLVLADFLLPARRRWEGRDPATS